MNISKKFFSGVLAFTLLMFTVMTVNPVFAEEVKVNDFEIVEEVPKEVRLRDFERQEKKVQEEVESSITPFDEGQYEYKYETSPTQTKTVDRELDGQLRDGIRIDGGFIIDQDRGTTTPLSFSVGLPKLPSASINVDIGRVTRTGGSAVSGYFLRTPDADHNYKARGAKTYELKVRATYRRPKFSNEPWELWNHSVISTLVSSRYYAVRVN